MFGRTRAHKVTAQDRIAQLATQISALSDRIERLETTTQQLVEQLSARASALHQRLDHFELNVKALASEVARNFAVHWLHYGTQRPVIVPLDAKLCTQSDFEADWLAYWRTELRWDPIYHRKLWELAYIAQALFNADKLRRGMIGLGFGCGREPLPSLFAKYGPQILATDIDPSTDIAQRWVTAGQHADSLESIRFTAICPDPAGLERISLRSIDMNAIPADLHGQFDFVWSAGGVAHLGSLDAGFRFIESSLMCLRPRGTAVYTFDYNLSNAGDTIDYGDTVLFQRRHILLLADRLARAGYEVAKLNFEPGSDVFDLFIDRPSPAAFDIKGAPHLRLDIGGFICTSFALTVTAPG